MIHHLVIRAGLWSARHSRGSNPLGWLTNKQFYDGLFTQDCKRNETDQTLRSRMLQVLNWHLTLVLHHQQQPGSVHYRDRRQAEKQR